MMKKMRSLMQKRRARKSDTFLHCIIKTCKCTVNPSKTRAYEMYVHYEHQKEACLMIYFMQNIRAIRHKVMLNVTKASSFSSDLSHVFQ